MKTVDLNKADGSLIELAIEAKEPLLIIKDNKPLVVVMPVEHVDLESLALSTNPDFLDMLEKSRARAKAEGCITSAQFREELGLPPAPQVSQ